MGTSTTVATGRFSTLARLAVALGFAATLLVGQAMVFDNSASAKMTAAQWRLRGRRQSRRRQPSGVGAVLDQRYQHTPDAARERTRCGTKEG